MLTPPQRLSAVQVLLECSHASVVTESSASDIVKALVSLVDKESDESGQFHLSVCAGHWLAKVGNASKDFISATSERIKKSKEICCLALIICITACSLEKSMCGGFTSLCSSLIDTVKEAMKRPQQVHFDAILAFRLILQMSVADPAVAVQVATHKIWTVVAQTNSFFYSSATIQYLKETSSPKYYMRGFITECIFEIFAIATQHYREHLHAMETIPEREIIDMSFMSLESNPGPYQLLLTALVSGDYSSRSSIVGRLETIFDCINQSKVGVLVALRQHIFRLGLEFETVANSNKILLCDNDELRKVQIRSRIIGTLKTLASKIVIDDFDLFTNFLLICGHPLTNGNCVKEASVLYRSFSLRLNLFSQKSANGITQILSDCIFSAMVSTRTCGNISCNLIHLHFPGDGTQWLRDHVVPDVLNSLDKGNYDTISDHDIDIFTKPVLEEPKIEEVSLADIKITNDDRKGKRGKFGGDFQEDEDWAEQIKREKAKKIMEVKSEAHREAQAKRSKEAEEVIGRVGTVLKQVEGALTFVEHVLRNYPILIIDNYNLILPVAQCMGFSLVSEIAARCVILRALHLEPNLRHISR